MLINKNKKNQTERAVKSVLDSYDADVIVVRNDGCGVLCMNEQAKERLDPELHNMASCKRSYSYIFPGLCDHCPKKGDEDENEDESFDLKSSDGRVFSIKRSTAEWIDGRSATVFTARDVDEERSAADKMYKLAYTDHLTGIANRQRLKEDFSELEPDIENGRVCGALCIFDMDNFKNINDTYGHNTGDAMLRRLTSHLEGDPVFKGHLYRLGGDEFVIVFTDSPSRFSGESEMRAHYSELLKRALQVYTMPAIEGECTLSMGAAFFPAHGDNISELLRKADIALYEAKSNGRNRLELFEDSFDKAKKFKDMYINIQPILIKNGNTYGYELVDNDVKAREDDETVSLTEFDRTLDALGLNEIRDNTKYFISFTKQLLNHAALKNLPKDKFVIQIRACGNCSAAELQMYKQLKSYGFALAVTNLDRESVDGELIKLADYCRFAPGSIGDRERRRIIAEHNSRTFIAENVSTAEEFEAAQQMGYKLFQGYFFNQQAIVRKTKDIEPLKTNYFRLLQLTSTDDYVDFNEIGAVIASDMALSYKLLRLLNSASVGLKTRVSSILMAVTFLGEENLKKWISVLALRGITDEKPLELVRMSLIRAHFGELLAPCFHPKKDARHVFMTGMLSLLHIALEKSKEELLEEIPVADEIRESLLTKEGPYSSLIAFFKDYEYANWDEVSRFAETNGLSCEDINDAYIKSVKWCNDLREAST